MVVGSPGSVVGRRGCLGMGWNFLRCFLFLNVVLPVPSTFTRYWSYSLHSTTLPVRSHRLGWLPTRFCRKTLSPCTSWARSLVWASHCSLPAMCLLAIACSLWSRSSFQVL